MLNRFPAILSALVLSLGIATGARAQNQPISPAELQSALASPPTGDAAVALANRIRAAFRNTDLKAGPPAKIDGVLAMWAIETTERNPSVAQVGNIRSWPLTRIGDSNLWAGVGVIPNFAVVAYQYQVGMNRIGGASHQIEVYPPHPDNQPKAGVPKGTVKQMPAFQSKVFEGTTRDWWVYTPAQYDPAKPAAVMVFQDGGGYLYAATAFDNLIHSGDMPVTVGIFINPGRFADGRSNRSFEYDTLSDRYARFIRDEILPEVGKTLKLTDDPDRRAICGASSGGICAYTVAWEMPDLFRKVLSHVGSFVNIAAGSTRREGGHNYAALLRKTPRKPLRVYLQDGANDLDNEHGSWPLANQEMAASLRYMGYDYRFDFGQGFHSGRHGQAILPDSLRWLWRDTK
jgi:enterochelin esterase family protein